MARKDTHVVRLTAGDRLHLTRLVRSGKHPARAVTHARILLKADREGGTTGRRTTLARWCAWTKGASN